MANDETNRSENNRYNAVFPSRLRGLMHEKKLKHDELAEKLGVTYRSVGTYCRGEVMPSGDMIVKIAKALSVSADYLLGLSDIRTICSGKEAVIDYLSIPEKTAENLHSLAVDESTSKPLSILLSCDFVPVLEAMEHLTDMVGFAKTAIKQKDKIKSVLVLTELEKADKQLKNSVSVAIEGRLKVKPREYIEQLTEIINSAHKTPADYERTIAELEAIWNYHSGQKTEGDNE